MTDNGSVLETKDSDQALREGFSFGIFIFGAVVATGGAAVSVTVTVSGAVIRATVVGTAVAAGIGIGILFSLLFATGGCGAGRAGASDGFVNHVLENQEDAVALMWGEADGIGSEFAGLEVVAHKVDDGVETVGIDTFETETLDDLGDDDAECAVGDEVRGGFRCCHGYLEFFCFSQRYNGKTEGVMR